MKPSSISLTQVSARDVVDAVNAAYCDYIVPMRFDAARFRSMTLTDDIDLDRSAMVRVRGQIAAIRLVARRGPSLRLAALGCAPPFRRSGLARALLLETIRAGTSDSCSELSLEVFEANAAAITLYQAVGFDRRTRLLGFTSDARPSSGEGGVRLEELDTKTLVQQLRSMQPDGEPWQLAPRSIAMISPTAVGYAVPGKALAVVTFPTELSGVLKFVRVAKRHRGEGLGCRILQSESMQSCGGHVRRKCSSMLCGWGGKAMARLVWRVKLVADLGSGEVSEVEVARIERDDIATAETIGLTLAEGKQLTAATQAEIVRSQVAGMGQRLRTCEHCGTRLSSKGHYSTTFRSVFGDVPVRMRRMCACDCRADTFDRRSFAAMAIGGVAPELAYVSAKFAALAPFARVAELLSELLPIGGVANPGTVRNRTMRVGTRVARCPVAAEPTPSSNAVGSAAIVGLDGGYVRSRHRRPERNFEIVAGKVICSDGEQHRFAFARNSASAEPFARALARIGISGRTPATVLSDGDAGLRNLQRRVLPEATVVLDWFHIAMRFEHALRAATALGAETPDAWLGKRKHRDIERAKWRLWHGRWKGCLVKLAEVQQWLEAPSLRTIVGARTLRSHLDDLLFYLEANQRALVNYGSRRRRGEPISTAFVESAVNEIIAKRMIKKQQMRWNRWTVQPFLDVRVAVLNGTLERSFRQIYPNFRPANDADPVSAAA